MLEARAKETGQSLWDVIRSGEFLTGKKFSGALNYFRQMMEDLQAERAEMSPSHLIERVLEQTGYLDWVEQQDNLEHTSRADNLRELANAMAEGTEQGQTLEDVLDRAALVADSDEYDETIPVSLMTFTAPKAWNSMRFFLPGSKRASCLTAARVESTADIEEERRLVLRRNDACKAVAVFLARHLPT